MNVTNMGCQEFELHLNLVGVPELFSASINAGRFECHTTIWMAEYRRLRKSTRR